MHSLPHGLPARLLFRNQMPEARLKAWGKEDIPLVEESGNTRPSWTFVSPWALMVCTHECRGEQQMQL